MRHRHRGGFGGLLVGDLLPDLGDTVLVGPAWSPLLHLAAVALTEDLLRTLEAEAAKHVTELPEEPHLTFKEGSNTEMDTGATATVRTPGTIGDVVFERHRPDFEVADRGQRRGIELTAF